MTSPDERIMIVEDDPEVRRFLVEFLEEGLTDYILDGQTFDLDGVRSIGSNPRHVATSPFTSYNYHGKGNFASMIDAVLSRQSISASARAALVRIWR